MTDNEKKLYDFLYKAFSKEKNIFDLINDYYCTHCPNNSKDGLCMADNECNVSDSATFDGWWYNLLYGYPVSCDGCINSGRPMYDYPCSSCNNRNLYDSKE